MNERCVVSYETLNDSEPPGLYEDALSRCASCVAAGNLIVYPTDTLYGIGADACSNGAVARVRAAKGRDSAKPILVLVANLAMLEQYAHVTPLARRLAERYWPGPLSLVLDTSSDSLAPVAGAVGVVGFRIPGLRWCRDLVARVGRPITSTSVNRSGESQPDNLEAMLDALGMGAREVSFVLDAGVLPRSAASTVVDARGSEIRILRQGAVVVT